jgi:hypothetical protein
MVRGSMGPNDPDVPRTVSLDYLTEGCKRHIISGDNVVEVFPNSDTTSSQLVNGLADVAEKTLEH